MRFHVLGPQHTITSKEYYANAFTQKVRRFCEMMSRRGHVVIHYGHEDSEVTCSEHVSVVSRDVFQKVYGDHDFKKNLFKWDENDEVYTTYNEKAIQEIQKRKRRGDFLLPFWGSGHKAICDVHKDMTVVEPGIGYPRGHFAPYKVWESYAVYHSYLTLEKVAHCFVDPREWERDTVIPNYYDPDELEYSKTKDDYFLFVGRIGTAKGVDYAIETTRRIGAKLIVAGQNAEEGLKEVNLWPPPPHVEVIGYIDLDQKKKLMSKAKAVICFSKFVEPGCHVHAEALLCGTPVISSDWGIFTEYVLHGITGFRCRTLDQMVKAAQNIHKIDPEVCRTWALKKFSYDAVAEKYEEYFQSIQIDGEFDQFHPHYLPALSDAEIDSIQKRLEGVALQDATIGTDRQVNHSTRRTKIFWLPKTDEFADIYTKVLDAIGKGNEKYYKFNLTGIQDSIQYSVYTGDDQGYYDWHIDAMKNHKRKISAVIQLSDPSEYEGGELQIQNGGISVADKSKGSFIIFPSWISHRVTPVTKGTRKTLVLWVDGPAFI